MLKEMMITLYFNLMRIHSTIVLIIIKTRGAFAELIYLPNGDDSKWYAVGLFNWIESDFSDLNFKTLSGHLGYVFRRNIRMVAEVNYDFTHEYAKFGVGFITAF